MHLLMKNILVRNFPGSDMLRFKFDGILRDEIVLDVSHVAIVGDI